MAQQGETFSANEVELRLIRHGQEEIIYVTFVYMLINDASGSVQKLAVWVVENTYQVTQRRKVEELVAERTQKLAATNAEYVALNDELKAASEEVGQSNKRLEEANLHLIRSNQNLEQFVYIASPMTCRSPYARFNSLVIYSKPAMPIRLARN